MKITMRLVGRSAQTTEFRTASSGSMSWMLSKKTPAS
jgi:hypothetical protein